jgi:predicted mannosyl-3-phosphoglycerate phosphatase (HAD superfamily)
MAEPAGEGPSFGMAPHTDRPVVCFLEIDDLLVTATREACKAAASAFAALDRRNIAIVLCSGQTHGELAHITRSLGFWHPFIAEDGSAIGLPHAYFSRGVADATQGFFWDVIDYGRSQRAVGAIIGTVAERLGIDVIRLSEMDAGRAERQFGVAHQLASRAIKRGYGDVLRVRDGSDASLDRLTDALRAERLRCTHRGRDLYVVPDHGGSRAVLRLRRLFLEHFADVLFVGIGTAEGAGLVPAVLDTCVHIGSGTLRTTAQLVADVVDEVRLFGASAIGPMTAAMAAGYRESRGADALRLHQH